MKRCWYIKTILSYFFYLYPTQMKILTAYCLLFFLLFYSLSQTVLFVHYSVNYDYYAHVLCVNKNRPSLHCNGKCHLKKELQQDERKKSSSAGLLKISPLVFLFTESQRVGKNFPVTGQLRSFFRYNFVPADFSHAVFRPPAC